MDRSTRIISILKRRRRVISTWKTPAWETGEPRSLKARFRSGLTISRPVQSRHGGNQKVWNSESALEHGKSTLRIAMQQSDIRFNHAPWESLRRENVLIWLSWVCLDLPLTEARKNSKYIECLDHTLEKLEERTGHIIPEGYNPSVRASMPTLDPIVVRTTTITGWDILTARSKDGRCCFTQCPLLSIPSSRRSRFHLGA